jgi:hypothetical protein
VLPRVAPLGHDSHTHSIAQIKFAASIHRDLIRHITLSSFPSCRDELPSCLSTSALLRAGAADVPEPGASPVVFGVIVIGVAQC